MFGVNFEDRLNCWLTNPHSITFTWGKFILANLLNRLVITI